MKELLIMAKSLGGGGSEVALIELINALPEELYNITLVLLDSDNEYAYRLKKKVNIVQLTFNSSFAKSLVSMYAFPAKVLKKLSVNSFIPYYDFISNCVTNVFEKTYDVAIDFYGYGSFVTAFLATKIQAKKKATWLHFKRLMMYVAVTVATCIITYGICTTVKLSGWTLLVIRLIICCTIPNIMFMILYRKLPEFKDSFAMIKKILKKNL